MTSSSVSGSEHNVFAYMKLINETLLKWKYFFVNKLIIMSLIYYLTDLILSYIGSLCLVRALMKILQKVIHWTFCKKLKSDFTNKWSMHQPASALETETF